MIINSLLDTDLYKLTMMQVIFHQFTDVMVEYEFKCRTPNIDLSPYVKEIQKEVDHLCGLRFTQEELDYLSKVSFFKNDFISSLVNFKFNNQHIIFSANHPFGLMIRGPWIQTILFETPLLAIISEVYSRNQHPKCDCCDCVIGRKHLKEKINLVKMNPSLKEFLFSDFGTRRRFSFMWHDEVISTLARELPNNLCGTSNIYFAKKFNLSPIGTMAHEYIQGCQVINHCLRESQKYAFEVWAKEYRNCLDIALSDTYNLDTFLKDFDINLCNLFDGVRQDSGDPFKWGDRMLDHYEGMGINPKTKKLIFSDNLTFPLAIKLHDYFKTRTNPSFGIGTNLTNDLGYPPIQIVIKMTECNGQPVAKISDNPNKAVCKDPSYLTHLKKVFEIN